MERSDVADQGKEFAIGGAMSTPAGSEWRLHAVRSAISFVASAIFLWLLARAEPSLQQSISGCLRIPICFWDSQFLRVQFPVACHERNLGLGLIPRCLRRSSSFFARKIKLCDRTVLVKGFYGTF